jgi:hypothetical protein
MSQHDADDVAIVTAVDRFGGKHMGLDTIAEGVERWDQLTCTHQVWGAKSFKAIFFPMPCQQRHRIVSSVLSMPEGMQQHISF